MSLSENVTKQVCAIDHFIGKYSFMLINTIFAHCIQHNENSMYAGPAKAITGSVLNKSQARK